MNKSKVIVGAVLVAVVFFYGGMQYGKSSATASAVAARGNFARGMGGRGANGGFTGGQIISEIISEDASSLTISLQTGGSKIIFFSSSTPIQKSVSGSIKDLVVGEQISANGTSNADGSLTAQSIQIRPATTTRAQ